MRWQQRRGAADEGDPIDRTAILLRDALADNTNRKQTETLSETHLVARQGGSHLRLL